MCVPDVIKNINVRVFNEISRNNKTRHIKWHETCKYVCRVDASVYNNKQRQNEDKCRCESKESFDKGLCDKGFIWNPSNSECKCGNHVMLENIYIMKFVSAPGWNNFNGIA